MCASLLKTQQNQPKVLRMDTRKMTEKLKEDNFLARFPETYKPVELTARNF